MFRYSIVYPAVDVVKSSKNVVSACLSMKGIACACGVVISSKNVQQSNCLMIRNEDPVLLVRFICCDG